MKAISLWQPWASAMAIGSKRIETRHWSTDVRGLVAIHAAKRNVKSELEMFGSLNQWKGALAQYRQHGSDDVSFLRDLPFGTIVAVGELFSVRPTRYVDEFVIAEVRYPHRAIVPDPHERATLSWSEGQMGDFTTGRYAWIFDNVVPVMEPIPFVGRQGFFNVPDELLEGQILK